MPDQQTVPITPSCRLQVILARDAPVGVIFRRTKKRVRLILWNTEYDTFLPGQWFHGRIYEHDSDLTPNGRYLVYYAGKYTSRTGNQHAVPIVRAWTAISRPPYLTALALWQSTYGGIWESNRDLRLSIPRNDGETHPDFPLSPHIRLVDSKRTESPDGDTVAYSGALRGWRFKQKYVSSSGPFYVPPQMWDKEDKEGCYRLIKTILGYGGETRDKPYNELFSLQHSESQMESPFPEGTCWADWDLQGRLVWARQGELWAVKLPVEILDGDLFAGATMLADFTAMVPEDVPPPDWAKRW